MKCSAQPPGSRIPLHRLIGFGLVGLLLAGLAACVPVATPDAPTPQLEPQIAGLKFYEFYSPL